MKSAQALTCLYSHKMCVCHTTVLLSPLAQAVADATLLWRKITDLYTDLTQDLICGRNERKYWKKIGKYLHESSLFVRCTQSNASPTSFILDFLLLKFHFLQNKFHFLEMVLLSVQLRWWNTFQGVSFLFSSFSFTIVAGAKCVKHITFCAPKCFSQQSPDTSQLISASVVGCCHAGSWALGMVTSVCLWLHHFSSYYHYIL